ncbi:B-cell receptor CD22-like [Cololabis saira]|uniref:B-cell receptor CD22-like n=1 Tax=Cololabis saira TaxID=129043 RepID=UPI002AD3A7EE|nr:B-cell receptor CD22-like [Cololabis saira]
MGSAPGGDGLCAGGRRDAPNLPSVSVSSSGGISEETSVTLSCSSDANPAANYTWYKEDEDSPKASGNNFTISDFSAENSGNYYCEAQNSRGRRRSRFHPIKVKGSLKLPVALSVTAASLVVIVLLLVLWIRRDTSLKNKPATEEKPDNSVQQMDEIHYGALRFSTTPADHIYSNFSPSHPHPQEESVVYATTRFSEAQAAVEDTQAMYSTVKKKHRV